MIQLFRPQLCQRRNGILVCFGTESIHVWMRTLSEIKEIDLRTGSMRIQGYNTKTYVKFDLCFKQMRPILLNLLKHSQINDIY